MNFVHQLFILFKWCFIVSAFTLIVTLVLINNAGTPIYTKYIKYEYDDELPNKNWRDFTEAQNKSLSILGRYLFLGEDPVVTNPKKEYTILIWKYGSTLERRHIKHFTNKSFDPFEKCSVKNCRITYNDTELPEADVVLFHMQRIKDLADLPDEKKPRPNNQRWVFLTDETPYHTFLTSKNKLSDYNGKFNWSMTYRMDSDVPVPYGRTVLLNHSVPYHMDFEKRNDVLVAIMGSNCGGKNNRWKYVRELQQHIKVDVYGNCGTLKCPGHFTSDCDKINQYKFYLAFENSNCAQYLTEKIWWNAYAKNAIPIVMGASQSEYRQLLPPDSYINVEDFASPANLARYILYVNKTRGVYNSYFKWKSHFEVRNEHGYFQSQPYHYCRLCEAINYNSKEQKVYNNLNQFWSVEHDCYKNWLS